MTTTIPAYIAVPPSGQAIAPPTDLQASQSHSHVQASSSSIRPSATAAHRPSFPPIQATTTGGSGAGQKKFSVPTSSLSTNVSDLLLSSLLPPNLPKLPASVNRSGDGRARELSTQREALSLPLVSNNFRRFVTKVCTVAEADACRDSSVADLQSY